MTALLVALLLASPCERVHPVDANATAPCSGDLYPVEWATQLLDTHQRLLPRCERLREGERRGITACRASRDACEADGAQLRAELAGAGARDRWTLPRIVGVTVAGAGALLAGVACATVRGEGERAAACGAVGLSLGVAVGLSW